MSEMVERVAKAIAMHWGCAPQTYDLNPDVRKDWAGYARAAIEAMREPTPNMILAGMETDAEMTAIAYRAMIDAALKEPASAVVK